MQKINVRAFQTDIYININIKNKIWNKENPNSPKTLLSLMTAVYFVYVSLVHHDR